MHKNIIDVVCGVFIEDDKVLICRRKEGMKNAGEWEFPGGKIISGESMLRGLRREIREELGIEIRVLKDLAKVPLFEGKYKLLAYECKAETPIEGSKDHDQLIWVEPNELLNYNLSKADREIIEQLIEKDYFNI